MSNHKKFYTIIFTTTLVIFHAISSSSLLFANVYVAPKMFWTRSLRDTRIKEFGKFLNNYQSSSQMLLPSANDNPYGKWWFLENPLPFPIVPVVNMISSSPSSEKSPSTNDKIEEFLHVIGSRILTPVPTLYQNQQEEKFDQQRWKNIVLRVKIFLIPRDFLIYSIINFIILFLLTYYKT